MFKTKLTLALASVGMLGVMASQQASAQANPLVVTATSGNSDLIFVAVDTATGESYYNNLGILSLTGSITSPITFSDASYAKFNVDTATDLAAGKVSYAVIGGGDKNGAANPVALNSYSTTVGGTADPGADKVINQNLAQFKLIDTNIIGVLNTANVAGGAVTQTGSGFAGGPAYTDASALTSWNGKFSGLTDVAAGSQNAFYNYTQNQANGPTGNSTEKLLGNFLYAGNTLTFTQAGGGGGGTTAPLPAAVWLLGSGLFGLMGIGRRRAA